MEQGTPKSLLQAIRNGMENVGVDRVDITLRVHVRDFLAQKFSATCLLARNPYELKMIQDLWFEITGEKL